jgi:hypothetical protein
MLFARGIGGMQRGNMETDALSHAAARGVFLQTAARRGRILDQCNG